MRIAKVIPGAFVLTAVAWLSPGAVLADAAQAQATAAQHAGFAAGQDNIDGARRHLHHTLNCLVGPDGDGFDQSAGNPCGQVGGAIPQTSDAEARARLLAIAAEVSEVIAGSDLAAVQAAASGVQEALAD